MRITAVVLLLFGFILAPNLPAPAWAMSYASTGSDSGQTPAGPPNQGPPASSPGNVKTKLPAPDDGTVNGHTYTSSYFGFTYTFPENLAVSEDFMEGQEDEANQAFLLLAAWGPAQNSDLREGVVVMADHNVYPNLRTAADYLEKTSKEHFQPQGFKTISPAHEVTFGGHRFYRIDYVKENIYQTLICTIWRNYVVGFNLAAPSSQHIEQLAQSLNSVRFVVSRPANSGTKVPAK